jgi:hypothetical protein
MLERRSVVATLGRVTSPRQVPQPGSADELDERSRQILDFEREAWRLEVPKARAIRERFGFSPTRYHQLLHRAVDHPAALAYDPMVVRRLHRLREARRRRRVAGRLGLDGDRGPRSGLE